MLGGAHVFLGAIREAALERRGTVLRTALKRRTQRRLERGPADTETRQQRERDEVLAGGGERRVGLADAEALEAPVAQRAARDDQLLVKSAPLDTGDDEPCVRKRDRVPERRAGSSEAHGRAAKPGAGDVAPHLGAQQRQRELHETMPQMDKDDIVAARGSRVVERDRPTLARQRVLEPDRGIRPRTRERGHVPARATILVGRGGLKRRLTGELEPDLDGAAYELGLDAELGARALEALVQARDALANVALDPQQPTRSGVGFGPLSL